MAASFSHNLSTPLADRKLYIRIATSEWLNQYDPTESELELFNQ